MLSESLIVQKNIKVFLYMRIIHTSDWHIGHSIYGRKRYEEFDAFLIWLLDEINRRDLNALLVSGDIFDTSTPSNRAQELYYRFLCRVAASSCRHVVIVAGNHDSPTLLNAPKELLKALDVHVVGSVSENARDEVLTLRNENGEPEMIVCAVPYLRDRDIRLVEAGESSDDKEAKLLEGIRRQYAEVGSVAEKIREEAGSGIPVVAMGHLFAAGGQTVDGDGVRELYVGSLARIGAGVFPECFDYIALGHLHSPQKVGGAETIRYSGSPLPMGFGESKQQKSLCLVEFNGTSPAIELVDVPLFQGLESVSGSMKDISLRISELSAAESTAWLEVVYDGDDLVPDLREQLEALIADTGMEILRVKNNRIVERLLTRAAEEETLDDMSPDEVFERCMDAHSVPVEQRGELMQVYKETMESINEEDVRAE